MKKIILIGLGISIIGLSAYFISQIFLKNAKIEKSEKIRKTIDWFEDYWTENDISVLKNNPIILIYFNPECEYCQHEARVFYNHKTKLESATWFWISDAGREEINSFSEEYGLNDIPYIHILEDSTGFLWQSAGVTTIPSILVYDQSGDLTHKFIGETKMEAILNALQ